MEVELSTVTVTEPVFAKTKQRGWSKGYPPLFTEVNHSSYTARGYSVLASEDIEQLHAFAKSIGVAPGFYEARGAYLISNSKRKAAIRMGAKRIARQHSIRS